MKSRKLICPSQLHYGDTIALVRPSSRLDEKAYVSALHNLRDLGFCVAEYSGRRRKDSFFAASDEDRAQELHWAFREPGIRAVLVCRGGYGSQRALQCLKPSDWAQWKPKLVVGYSDTTYLHQWLQNQLGWISIHGPLVGFLDKISLQKLGRSLTELPVEKSESLWSEVTQQGRNVRARGRLVGGNLSLLSVRGPAELPQEDLILALEDVNENFYRIDRMLRSLIDAGYDRHIRGIILGTFKGCGEKDGRSFGFHRILETLRNLCRGPIWQGARFGHGLKQQRLLPLGLRVEMDGRRLRFLEGVVSPRC